MSMNIDRDKIKVLSLFDGMSCGALAMNELGITPDRYVAYEIDKYAIQTSRHNFPNIEHMGDVFDADFTEYKGFDFVIGGSPCTKWSIAQTKDREVEAIGEGWEWFSQFSRAINEAKPLFFIYENNKSMSNQIRDSITKTLGVNPVCINSALVSGQNRQRLYWVGKRNDKDTYDAVNVKQPQDLGVLLKHLLDDNAIVERDKGYCLKHQEGNARDYFKKRHTNIKFEPVALNDDTSKTSCDYSPLKVGIMPNAKGECLNAQANRIYDIQSKGVSLRGTTGGSGAKTELYAIPCEILDGSPTKAVSQSDGKAYITYRVSDGMIEIKGATYPTKLDDGYYIIRKLSVNECKRLQTVPEWYEFPVSDRQAYKMLGNGWTVKVISHIMEACLSEV